jgi:DNA processing protein
MLQEISLDQCDPVLNRLQQEFPKDLQSQKISYVGSLPRRDRFHLGIVGSRRPSPESRIIIDEIFSRIADLPVRIISGGALGVDAQSHAAALKLNIPTYSWVVGDPELATPHTNRSLFSRIAAHPGSAIMTPQCLYRKRNLGLFASFWLERNAWIAANSDLLIVVQAKEQSGTWSTVKMCQDFGITVYAVTGSPIDACYSGNNRMISMTYAHPLAHIEEFAQELRSHINDSLQLAEKGIRGRLPLKAYESDGSETSSSDT